MCADEVGEIETVLNGWDAMSTFERQLFYADLGSMRQHAGDLRRMLQQPDFPADLRFKAGEILQRLDPLVAEAMQRAIDARL